MRTIKLNPWLIMRDWSIGTKLSIGFGLIFFFTLGLAATSLSNLVAVQRVVNSALDEGLQIQAQANRIENGLAAARREEQAFLLNWREIGYENAVNEHVIPWGNQTSDIQQAIRELNELTAAGSGESFAEITRNVNELSTALNTYRTEFNQAINQLQDMGTSSSGAIGNLETAGQALEAELRTLERPDIVESFLQLRLSEVGYRLEGRERLQDQVVLDLEQLRTEITDTVTTDNEQLLLLVANYETAFTELVRLNNEIESHNVAYINAANSIQPLALVIGAQGAALADNSLSNVSVSVQSARTALIIAAALAIILTAALSVFFTRQISRPLRTLTDVAGRIIAGDLTAYAESTSKDEIGTLTTTFNSMTRQLQELIGSLEQRVAARTQALEVSAEVSRSLSTILDQQQLVAEVVKKMRDTFDYYHAHIYLLDEAQENLVMAGGTGEAGQKMLANEHKIPVGKGLVGRSAATNMPTIVSDVTTDPDWLPNPLLPDTQAEVAVPITLEGEVLGVLDVQNNEADSLGQEDVNLLLAIAGQVAIGLQNAKLFTRAEQEKAQMQTILESISLPIVISRAATGLVAYVNEALTQTFRLPREELIGKITPDFYKNPDDRERFLAALREQGVAKDFEMVLKRGDGELFWGMASGRTIIYEDEPAIIASIMDIQARKEAESLLAKQANELSIVAQVSTVAATILDPQELLQQVSDLTRSSFGLYHAHIHLLDEHEQALVLTAGAGDIGRQMVAEGRRIPLSAAGSLVASVARNVKGAIRNYETPEEGFMPHPLLMDTRSEMAVPIAIGQQVLGVLDVRADQLDYFGESDLQTVTTLASQIAVALQNARSYTKSEEAVQELQELSRRLTREGWNEFFEYQRDDLTFRYSVGQASSDTDSDEAPAMAADNQASLAHPLQVQGESIGELLLGSIKQNKDEAAEIVAAVAERLSAHLENLRLSQQTQNALNETQRRTEELAVLNEMSQTLTAQTTVDGVFQTVYNYLSRLMDTTDFYTVIYDEENDEVEFVLTASGEKLRWHTERRQAGNGVTEYLIRQRQSLLMPENVGQRLAALGIEGYGKLPESWLGVPIILGDRVLGVIGLESYTTPHLYNEQHLTLLTAVANQAAIAIESTRLLQSSVALAEEEQILRQITTRVSAAIDAESILRTAAEEIGRALGLEGYVSLEAVGSNGTNGHEPVAKSHGRTDVS